MSDSSGWPDPARPGVPLNPERAWPHWVSYLDPDMPAEIVEWNGHAWGNRETPPEQMAEAWHYHGPVLTPAEVETREAAAAEAMREACANVAAERGAWASNDADAESLVDRLEARGRMDAASEIAAAIRARGKETNNG